MRGTRAALGMGRMGMGRMGMGASNDGPAVMGGVAAICAIGAGVYGMWLLRIADRKPKTFSPQWVAATAKYRAAQQQDPISQQ
mmetsp:Transcript_75440/g.149684  ORF Transcript_75440/g.149684 Transcript_75440/m.149684 type:complete len:83 (+) Transcript_75440:48-296(+)|eukprot:CAMPEP_0174721776 /NCGR_PEP_ID=MMETSP1094-20130205/37139_1 /TAXON_ID=156173 /ORGANISM="Chrysochromulina brevifilum, Strain UTEX LB 985" /LENGTH=82 /DNA_ID=CAMNT_0015922527 /DNA_START=34 /DNA_END=282 /DNA_ORIENTATION=+